MAMASCPSSLLLLRAAAAAGAANLPPSSSSSSSLSLANKASLISKASSQSGSPRLLRSVLSTGRYQNLPGSSLPLPPLPPLPLAIVVAGSRFPRFGVTRRSLSLSSSSSSSSPLRLPLVASASAASSPGMTAENAAAMKKAVKDGGLAEEEEEAAAAAEEKEGSSRPSASASASSAEMAHDGGGATAAENVVGEMSSKTAATDLNGEASSGSKSAKGTILGELRWDHSFTRELPGDPRIGGPVRQVLHACYSQVAPSVAVKDPQLVSWSEPVAQILDIDPKEFARPDFALLFSGGASLKGSFPYAQCYGGHQFGVWAGQLGDGRAITLGEILNKDGERWELQLKGAGKTPYSRMADGLAVLRSSVREYLCSEAMHHLGVPTTRALSLVMTGASVERDMFYDGHPKLEPGAVVCRVAPSFLRFGSYQIHAARTQEDLQTVKKLADYAIRFHFPQFMDLPFEKQEPNESSAEEGTSDSAIPDVDVSKNKYAAWFTDIAERTAVMIAKWQGVGFTHGVMNTDNMSILGLTIDYGPFGFLDAFDPKFTPNTTDLPGRRYCFANQPDIGLWNTVQLANTLHSADLLSTKEAQYGLSRYADRFMDEYRQLMSKKMGLKVYNKDLLTRLLNNLATDKVDYTNFFRVLGNMSSSLELSDDKIWLPLKPAVLDLGRDRKKVWVEWLRQYTQQLSDEGVPDTERKAAMNKVNPKYILRNYLCQTAIDQAEIGDFSEVDRLLKLMERPYDDQPGMEKYARLPPAWAYRPGVCMLSCSS